MRFTGTPATMAEIRCFLGAARLVYVWQRKSMHIDWLLPFLKNISISFLLILLLLSFFSPSFFSANFLLLLLFGRWSCWDPLKRVAGWLAGSVASWKKVRSGGVGGQDGGAAVRAAGVQCFVCLCTSYFFICEHSKLKFRQFSTKQRDLSMHANPSNFRCRCVWLIKCEAF
jgi:hypothetical protein